MPKPASLTALAACLALTSTTTRFGVVQSTPFEYNPRAVVGDVVALTHSHPAYGGELASTENAFYEERTYRDDSDAEDRDLDAGVDTFVLVGPSGPVTTATATTVAVPATTTITATVATATNTSASSNATAAPEAAIGGNDIITFANERLGGRLGTGNASNETGTVFAPAVTRRLEATSTDIQRLESYFKTSMELSVSKLAKKGSAPTMPWPSSYWPTYLDGINYAWNPGQASPAAKYASAFGLKVDSFTKSVSQATGVLSQSSRTKCSSNQQCSTLGDGSTCAKRTGENQGYCIPTWFGICHAWSPAAILESEPSCAVKKNGVTFQPMDIKALLTEIYDGADLTTVFTGVRFNGPDSGAKKDQYGRYTDAARRDLGAGYFHVAVTNLLGKLKKTFILDVTGGAQVWNQPVYSYEVLKQDEMTTQQGAKQFFGTNKYPFNSRATSLMYVQTKVTWIVESLEDGALVKTGRASAYTQSGTYSYVLELDGNKRILGGEWVDKSRDDHPDFLWFAAAKPADSTVTSSGLSYKNVKELLASSLKC